MISMYIPGNSLLHRTPAGWKLLGLAVLALALFLVPTSFIAAGIFLLLGVAGYLLGGIPLRFMIRDIARLSFLLLFLVVTQLIFLTPEEAATNTARVIAVILLAQVLTRTTRTDGIISSAEKLFSPLRRFGVNPQKIGLAIALVLASVGQLSATIQQVRDAQRTRGVRMAPWVWVVPVLVLSLKHADDVSDALTVRGFE